jgi:hypothetical protein
MEAGALAANCCPSQQLQSQLKSGLVADFARGQHLETPISSLALVAAGLAIFSLELRCLASIDGCSSGIREQS